MVVTQAKLGMDHQKSDGGGGGGGDFKRCKIFFCTCKVEISFCLPDFFSVSETFICFICHIYTEYNKNLIRQLDF